MGTNVRSISTPRLRHGARRAAVDTLTTHTPAPLSVRHAAAAQLQRSVGNQAVLRLLGKSAAGPDATARAATAASIVQRKPVPRLVKGRVYWYDDTDPTERLFETREQCEGNAGGAMLNPQSLPGLALSGPIVKTWSAPSLTSQQRGGAESEPGTSPALLPIFDIRTAGRRPPSGPGQVDLRLAQQQAYFGEFAADGPLAQLVLILARDDTLLAAQILRLLAGDLRSVEGALLVRDLLANGIPRFLIKSVVRRGAAAARGLTPLVVQLARMCSSDTVARLVDLGLTDVECGVFANVCTGPIITRFVNFGLNRLELGAIAASGLLQPGMTTLAGYSAEQIRLLLGACTAAGLQAVTALGLTRPGLDKILKGMSAADLAALALMQNIAANHVTALADFGLTHVTTLRQTLSSAHLIQLVGTYSTTTARQRMVMLLTGAELCTYLTGELGTRNLMRHLLGAANGAQLTGPITALGQAAYAFLLQQQLKPAKIVSLQPHLAGVAEADMQTALTRLRSLNRYLKLVALGAPHRVLAGLIDFGPVIVDQLASSCTGPEIAQIHDCIVGPQVRADTGGLLASGLPTAGLLSLCAEPLLAGCATQLQAAVVTGAQLSTSLNTLSAPLYVQLLDARWNPSHILQLSQAFLVNNAGRSRAEWVQIAVHASNTPAATITTFCGIAGWSPASIGLLLSSFVQNANGLTAADWVAIAADLNHDEDVAAIAFAQLDGWTLVGLTPLVRAFHANPNRLSAAKWVQLALLVQADAHADVIPFAQLTGWNEGPITQLLNAFLANNPNTFTAENWATIALRQAVDAVRPAIQVARGGEGRDIILTREARFAEVYPNAVRLGVVGWQGNLDGAIGPGRYNVATRAASDTRHVGAIWPRADSMSHWTQGGNTTLTGFVAHVGTAEFFVAFGNHAGPNTYNITWRAANDASAGPYQANQVTI